MFSGPGIAGLLLTVLLFGLLCPKLTNAENILAVFSYTFGSSYLLITPFLRNLVQRGHQLTLISAVTIMPHIEGVHHIRVPKLDMLMKILLDFEYDTDLTKWTEAQFLSEYFYNCSKFVLEDPGVQELLRNASAKYSLIILEASHNDALYGFSQHFNAPLLGVAAYGSSWNIDFLVGNSAPSVYEPMSALGYTSGLNLIEKWHNLIYITEERLVERFIYLPRQIDLYKQHFPGATTSIHDLRRRFSLVLINQHFTMGRVRSNVPNIVEVAGMHLDEKPYPLDAELKKILDEAEHGVIYFSMGLQLLDHWLPPGMRASMSDAFAQLKQQVIWKTDYPEMVNQSRNVFARTWFPQRAILNHPNVKLFITHAGLLSLIESVHYAVPLLCIPLFYDQFQNTKRMEKLGVARKLDFKNLFRDEIVLAIEDLVYNASYKRNARDLSQRFHDQPMSAMDTAIWWTEYILRHKGADHMRIAEQEMSLMQYYNVDVVSVLFGRIGLSAIIVIFLGWKLVSLATRHLEYRLNVPMVR
uniref:UDP-glucuronosyltransferase n=1 Tax=Drosophila melanogaster TaxID=7227 RepID=Q9VGS7_DROME|nr:UDP-glycosyltransferase family 303 member A1, isoform B [Drosophila melanogaster]NP_652621.1 UDP-glycosyltransferase family 303 member A1, isoform A [Drosophila melanogaster]AAF54598.1 UDP-glycosyltransferase family 303 member A1, isoform A [Drosophila melanogaster]AGB95852.1 UDP-glycosyltransferase family 303 member A1, isoform B [Drosophila melanogaster]|eukprot:NP_001262470.1 Ugt86Dh, isoform B [Drosophila melanogaster]